jgi:hypothetical protein
MGLFVCGYFIFVATVIQYGCCVYEGDVQTLAYNFSMLDFFQS